MALNLSRLEEPLLAKACRSVISIVAIAMALAAFPVFVKVGTFKNVIF
ncbi:MAG: hypothetical protein IPP71_05685 [Bacteroidetes bacterium]|nr:hypothetical protein [Bacteroidota bacterium]